MIVLKGFWSYVHSDDFAEKGRIIQLAKDVKQQYEMGTGDEIELFVDREDIKWGEAWHHAIDSRLTSVAFFIPIITPRFFHSSECRRELQTIAHHALKLGINGLVLPILYVDVDEFKNDETEDELIQLIKSLQWEDWTDLRFREVESEGYRRGVHNMVQFLIETNRRSEQIDNENDEKLTSPAFDDDDDSLGIMEKLARFEEELKQLPNTLQSMTEDLDTITEIMKESTQNTRQSDQAGGGFGARLAILKRTAGKLKEPVENIWTKSNLYASQIHNVDVGYRIIIDRAISEVAENPDSKEQYCSLFESVRFMSEKSSQMTEAIQTSIEIFRKFEEYSRDMRPVVRRLNQGMTILVESSEVSKEWVKLIEATGIECEE